MKKVLNQALLKLMVGKEPQPAVDGSKSVGIDFQDTDIAFRHLSNRSLWRAYGLFKLMSIPGISQLGPKVLNSALNCHIPVNPIIRHTIFKQFCGGESLADCQSTIDELSNRGVGVILDFATEGLASEVEFDSCSKEVLENIELAKSNSNIPFCVFKPTGLAPFKLLEKVSEGAMLSEGEKQAWERAKKRYESICEAAHKASVRIFVDAEETWIQKATDDLVEDLMVRFNQERPIVFNTVQMYRTDRLAYIESLYKLSVEKGFHIGLKVVRGAYMEKERDRAEARGYESPIQPTKAHTDNDYDAALDFCITNGIAICAGTHNEVSTGLTVELMDREGLQKSDKRVEFAQLLGMSDNLTYNLSFHGYSSSKYVPYGPIQTVFPYLTRRAEENSAIDQQTSREMDLLAFEMSRRARLTK